MTLKVEDILAELRNIGATGVLKTPTQNGSAPAPAESTPSEPAQTAAIGGAIGTAITKLDVLVKALDDFRFALLQLRESFDLVADPTFRAEGVDLPKGVVALEAAAEEEGGDEDDAEDDDAEDGDDEGGAEVEMRIAGPNDRPPAVIPEPGRPKGITLPDEDPLAAFSH